MHAVYASSGAIDAYGRTGHFPDRGVLVKASRLRLRCRITNVGFDVPSARGIFCYGILRQ